MKTTNNTNPDRVVIQQVKFDANNISTWIINTGIFNQDLSQVNWPGFEWPKGTGKFAVFTTGLCIGAYINNRVREAVASYKGELAPGYVVDTLGAPMARTNCSFKIYKVKNTDHNSSDWLHWGQMVPRGAPFVDVNGNGSYEPAVDTPGMSGAAQTIFACLTDGFYEEHKIGEGFGGGTHPLYAELHLTAWAYTIPGLQDVQFFKWVIINRGDTAWEKTYFAIFSDCDLGFPNDDFNGCDTSLQLGYTYNDEDMDGTGNGVSYGLHPPAVGFALLQGAVNRYVFPAERLKMTSFDHVMGTSVQGPICEKDPNGEPIPAYYLMSGRKKDQTPWVVPPGGTNNVTKFCYSGDPESGQGWTEGIPGNPSGCVQNCGGLLTGTIINVNIGGDRRFIMSTGADNLTVNPGDTQTIVIAQMITRGANNLNSVTKLKQLAANVLSFYHDNFKEEPLISFAPDKFEISQNYPNPFNVSTNIKIQIPYSSVTHGEGQWVSLIIYDILGHQIKTLLNQQLRSGIYNITWDGTNYPSGVYFYRIKSNSYNFTKKMVLIK